MSAAVPVFVGVDVAKAELVWAARPTDAFGTVPNDEPGIARLVDVLRRLTPELIVLEATGGP
jgi:transposase